MTKKLLGYEYCSNLYTVLKYKEISGGGDFLVDIRNIVPDKNGVVAPGLTSLVINLFLAMVLSAPNCKHTVDDVLREVDAGEFIKNTDAIVNAALEQVVDEKKPVTPKTRKKASN